MLISDLSFDQDHNLQKIKPGNQLIKNVRNEFPDLKIVVFSIEDKPCTIQTLLNEYHINAYVWKNREGLRELKKALKIIDRSDTIYISPELENVLSKNNAIEITDYDVFLIKCLSQGALHKQISEKLKILKLPPFNKGAVEKRLNFLKEHFNANNPKHLVNLSKDLGLI